jgi:hypothetical protein
MINILIAILYIVSNIQLVFIIYRFKRQNAWLILTTTPNRYLYSLLFLPIQISINLYCLTLLWALLPVEHSQYYFLTPYLMFIYSIAFSALFTAIDYFNGNAGYTDLRYPYNISVIQARNTILREESSSSWKCTSVQHSAVLINVRTAKRVARGKENDIAFLVNYVRSINTQVSRLTDTRLWSLNLFNVFVFVGSVFWTIVCCILLCVFKNTGIVAGQSQQFETICNLQLISVFIIVIWLQFRAYEFAEFTDIGWKSNEKIDIVFAGIVIIACMIMIAIAKSSSDPIKYLVVLAFVGSMYNLHVRRFVREICGSWMKALNLVVNIIIVLLVLGVLYMILWFGK